MNGDNDMVVRKFLAGVADESRQILGEGTSPEGLPSNSQGVLPVAIIERNVEDPEGVTQKNVCYRIDVGKGNPFRVGCTTALRYPPVAPVAIGMGGRFAAGSYQIKHRPPHNPQLHIITLNVIRYKISGCQAISSVKWRSNSGAAASIVQVIVRQ
jgi:hypothetical protein